MRGAGCMATGWALLTPATLVLVGIAWGPLDFGLLMVPVFWVAFPLALGGALGAVIYALVAARRLSKALEDLTEDEPN